MRYTRWFSTMVVAFCLFWSTFAAGQDPADPTVRQNAAGDESGSMASPAQSAADESTADSPQGNENTPSAEGEGEGTQSLRNRRQQMARRLEALRREQAAAQGQPAPDTSSSQPSTGIVPSAGSNAEAFPDTQMEENQYITMNFRDVDIQVLAKFMSDLTGISFVIDPKLKLPVTILSPKKIPVDQAYQVFLSVLEVNGMAAVQAGNVVKIVPAADAKAKGIEITTGMSLEGVNDRVITQLIPLQHGDASDFAKFLGPLVPKSGLLIPYPSTNTLIAIDTQSNMQRLLSIVKDLDIPGAQEHIRIFELSHAGAEKISSQLTQLFAPTKGSRVARESVKIISDDRTNSLIVLAPAQTMSDIAEMLGKLDRKLDRQRDNIHVYALQNAVAEDVAQMLGEISSEAGSEQNKEEGKIKTPALSKDVKIYADKATNTLMIIADPDEYAVLETIIRALDVHRTMVYVEALIMEVSTSKSLDLGVEWQILNNFDGGYATGSDGGVFVQKTPGGSAVNSLTSGNFPSEMYMGVVGNAITLGDQVFPSFGAFIRAVRSDSDFNVISTPQILTLDNQDAMIDVGQNIPFVTTSVEQGAVGDRPIQTFEYKDVGVTLSVTPHINDNRMIRLYVEQSTKSVVNSTALGGSVLAPTTTYRNAKTTIVVKDGETAVIGGLIQARMDRGRTQTPCLGGVPGAGWLFKSTSDRDEKTNLLVFLAPHIIENPNEAREFSSGKKREIDRQLEEAIRTQQTEELRREAFK